MTGASEHLNGAASDRGDHIHYVVDRAFPRARSKTRRWMVAHADVRAFGPGQTVVAQGHEGETIVVLNGHIGLRRTTLEGREVIPRIVAMGQLASLLPIARRPTVFECVALTPSRVAVLSGADLRALAEEDAGLGMDLLEHALDAMMGIVEQLDGLLHQDASRRVARVLQQHAALFFGDAAVLTRAYLPALVGTSREMTGRVLRRLEADGVVARVGPDRLQLLDAAALARTASIGPTGV